MVAHLINFIKYLIHNITLALENQTHLVLTYAQYTQDVNNFNIGIMVVVHKMVVIYKPYKQKHEYF